MRTYRTVWLSPEERFQVKTPEWGRKITAWSVTWTLGSDSVSVTDRRPPYKRSEVTGTVEVGSLPDAVRQVLVSPVIIGNPESTSGDH